jgi:uncharacterized metal-binding protein
MVPSWQDLRNMFFSIVIAVLGVVLTLDFLNMGLSDLSIPSQAFVLLSTVFLLLILALVFSIVIFALSKLVKPT